jgi:N-acylglucosamine-6-phosphate 2-epimerase
MKTSNPKNRALLDSLKGGLIVSCQVQKDDPVYTDDIVVKMAEAAQWAGAVGIRSNMPKQIAAIKDAIDLPIIGLWKVWHDDTDVFITPTMHEVDAIIEAGADIVAMDCTNQRTHEGTIAWNLLPQVKEKYPDLITFADVSNLEEGRRAVENGADIVAPTLYGYTAETYNIEGPDFRMFGEFCRELGDDVYVMMEGHIYTPEDAMKCVFLGAHAVVVGSAITRPHLTAARFVDLLSGYQHNWRDAEKAKH